jgi:hypothetical protein
MNQELGIPKTSNLVVVDLLLLSSTHEGGLGTLVLP